MAREYLEALLIAAVFLGFTNTFVVKTFYIPSPSMENTLLIGDHLFVNRFVYGPVASKLERLLLPLREVRRGDVIIFRSLENPEMDMVKRCVATPSRCATSSSWSTASPSTTARSPSTATRACSPTSRWSGPRPAAATISGR